MLPQSLMGILLLKDSFPVREQIKIIKCCVFLQASKVWLLNSFICVSWFYYAILFLKETVSLPTPQKQNFLTADTILPSAKDLRSLGRFSSPSHCWNQETVFSNMIRTETLITACKLIRKVTWFKQKQTMMKSTQDCLTKHRKPPHNESNHWSI